jgi:branched-chain amino acid transport system ATP-binding protein
MCTFLLCVAGLVGSAHDSIRFRGEPIGDLPAYRVVGLGIALVPEGRRLFPSLSVEENLLLGGYSKRKGPWNVQRVYDLFPILKERRRNPGTALSGGQQQMVAIGRALLSNPKLLLCDEISLGLAPVVIKDIYATLPSITGEGTSVLVVEQDINQALAVARRVYCFQEGRVTLQGRPAELTRDQISHAYFGIH